jgi:hypothetical protein
MIIFTYKQVLLFEKYLVGHELTHKFVNGFSRYGD